MKSRQALWIAQAGLFLLLVAAGFVPHRLLAQDSERNNTRTIQCCYYAERNFEHRPAYPG